MFDVSFKNQEDRQPAANVILQRSLFFLLWIRSPFAPMQSKWEQKKNSYELGWSFTWEWFMACVHRLVFIHHGKTNESTPRAHFLPLLFACSGSRSFFIYTKRPKSSTLTESITVIKQRKSLSLHSRKLVVFSTDSRWFACDDTMLNNLELLSRADR